MSFDPKSLREMVALMTELGVLRYKQGDLELELSGFLTPVVANQPEPEPKSEPVKEVKRGKDGLTAEDQEALYGRVMDARE